jgi:hypothetical protein
MKKSFKTKLTLDHETIRALDSRSFSSIAGGISGNRQCNYSQLNCDSMEFSNCDACKSDVCTF